MTAPASEDASDDRPIESLSFEEALNRLEGLIATIESGEAGLEESIAEYEQGAALVKRCRAVLDRAERRIAELTIDAPSEGEAGDGAAVGDADEDVPF